MRDYMNALPLRFKTPSEEAEELKRQTEGLRKHLYFLQYLQIFLGRGVTS